MGVVIIIPAHNEAATISRVIQAAKNYGRVVVVDDGSTDNTAAVARRYGVVVLQHIVNLGKGCALKTGCDYAVREHAEHIVVIDADAQHDPHDIPLFLDALNDKDIVFGYRTLSNKMPRILRFGNEFINNVSTVLYGLRLHDTQCGYRAFTREAYKKLRWSAQDYSVESEMVSSAGKHGLRYAEVPIKTVYTNKYKGTTVIDGVKIVMKMIWWKVATWF
jgi:UDP-N-acetylglucosamine---dolichyl-phosphate N-acetylglucosaminyltransferase